MKLPGSRLRFLLLLGLAVLVSALGLQQLALRSGAPQEPYLGYTLYTERPEVASLDQLSFELDLEQGWDDDAVVRAAQLELRLPGYERARWDYYWELGGFGNRVQDQRVMTKERGWSAHRVVPDDLRLIGPTPSGDYRLALLVNGKRVSNVMAFRITPTPASAPVLQLGTLEPTPVSLKRASLAHRLVAHESTTPWFREQANTRPLLRLVAPSPPHPAFNVDTFRATPLLVDGLARRYVTMIVSGPVGSIQASTTPLNLDGREPKVNIGRPHNIEFRLGGYSTGSVRIDPKAVPLHREWETSGWRYEDRPAPSVSIQGFVRDREGRPAVNVWVKAQRKEMRGGGMVTIESEAATDETGRYRFLNLPPAEYKVSIDLEDKVNPHVSQFATVAYDGSRSRAVDFGFRTQYRVSGVFLDQAGNPRMGKILSFTWTDPVSGVSFQNSVRTEAEGKFAVEGPFRRIALIEGPYLKVEDLEVGEEPLRLQMKAPSS